MNEVWEIYQGDIRWKHPFKIQTHIVYFKRFRKDSILNLSYLIYIVFFVVKSVLHKYYPTITHLLGTDQQTKIFIEHGEYPY